MTIMSLVAGSFGALLGLLVMPGLIDAAKSLVRDEIIEGLPSLSMVILRAAADRHREPERTRLREEYLAILLEDFDRRRLSGLRFAMYTYLMSRRRAAEAGEADGQVVPYAAAMAGLQPMVAIEVTTPHGRLFDQALVDSGADETIIPRAWMALLGLCPAQCSVEVFETTGGDATLFRAETPLVIRLLGVDVECSPLFGDVPTVLLGRNDVLQNFVVTIDQPRHRLIIRHG
jgi:hypothetical protein